MVRVATMAPYNVCYSYFANRTICLITIEKDYGFFVSLTFDFSVGNVTLTSPPQRAVYQSLASTCHNPPIYQTLSLIGGGPKFKSSS